jgi:hypothetical protein
MDRYAVMHLGEDIWRLVVMSRLIYKVSFC